MKIIEMKVGKLSNGSEIDYKGLIANCLNSTPQGGFDVKTMRSRIRIMDAIESVDGPESITLEEADYNVLKDAVSTMKWGISDKFIVEFYDSVMEAK